MMLPASLSEREKEVAALLLQGKSNKQIAQALGVSTRTAEFHVSHVYEKLGVASRAEAIVKLAETSRAAETPAQGTESAYLRESTGAPVGEKRRETTGDLRESTVEKDREPTDNGRNLKRPFWRIAMQKILVALVILFAVVCLAIPVIGFLFFFNLRVGQNLRPSSVQVTQQQVIVEPTYTPWVTPTPMEATGAQPTPTEWPIQRDGDRYRFEGLGFELDPAIAGGPSARVIVETTDPANSAYWSIYPQHLNVALAGYPLSDTFFKPEILVFPVDEYRRVSSYAGEEIDSLITLLEARPADARKFPFLPLINAGQVFHTRVEYLDFQNGSGVRYLAMFAQSPDPVTSQNLTYIYQGLTADGRHYVSVILPVGHPSLPASPNALPVEELQAIAEDNENYRAETAAALAAQPEGTFIPELSKLDALIASIEVDR